VGRLEGAAHRVGQIAAHHVKVDGGPQPRGEGGARVAGRTSPANTPPSTAVTSA
jgi:hypothetical protein